MNLPESIDYSSTLPVLPPESKRISVVALPTSGATFSENSQISLDLISRGFLDVDSMYLTYDYSLTSAANAEMKGTPAYTPFIRQDLQVGSSTIDTIQNYNNTMNVLVNATMSVAEKFGQMSALGYNNNVGIPNNEAFDGRLMTLNETGTFSAPFVSLLSNAEKAVPLFAMPAVRYILTLDSLSNIFTSTVSPTGFTISNVQLHYDVIDYGTDVEQMVRQNDKIQIKSQSFAVSQQTLAAGSSGTNSLIFNQRYSSVKALIGLFGGSAAGGNGSFDAVNPVANSSLYYNVAGMNYPSRPLTTQTNRAGILMEMRKAFGSIYDKTNSQSINAVEFNYDGIDAATTYNAPSKLYFAVSTEVVNNPSIFTGISTENSPISLIVNLPSATAANSVVSLICNYDAIIEVDMVSQMVEVKK